MSTPRIVVADAFASAAFSGNPAAVCLVDKLPSDSACQQIAAELNLSETAFPIARGDGSWDLRWFTPTTEVELCGHATLATAHVLWTEGITTSHQLRFHSAGGELCASRDDEHIWLDFPALSSEPTSGTDALWEALGCMPLAVQASHYDLLIEVDSAETVRLLKPDFAILRTLGWRAIIVTATGEDGYDVISRCFAPAAGINEDPVTGSAHCVLGPYWSRRLHRNELRCYQASQRGGEVLVHHHGARVALGGKAVTVWRGSLAATVA